MNNLYRGNRIVPSPSSLSSASVDSVNNTDGNISFYRNIMNSPISSTMSNMSPLSTASEGSGSAYSFQNLNISSPGDYFSCSNSTQPYLEIIEQPIEKFRFRYKSEMHGTHGSLTGQTTARNKKTYPTVLLHNFYREAIVRCSLYQIQKDKNDIPSPHSHNLAIRCGNEDRKDPHEIIVSPSQGYKAVFQGMGIIHTARRYIEEELLEKLITQAEFKLNRPVTLLEKEKLKMKANKEATEMNLNQVSLCFEAFERANSECIPLCPPVFSTPINNMKSALTGELRITRLSTVVGSTAGNDDLFLFVEKVGKKNIKVRFFEVDQYDYVLWEDWGKFSEADVHHQYAIALKTPPYRTNDIDKSVKVYIQLYRPGDNSHSEPVEFRYKSSNSFANNTRKRPRVSSTYNSAEIPLVINDEQNTIFSQPQPFQQQQAQPQQQQQQQQLLHQQQQQKDIKANQTISTEFDTQKIIQEALLSAADSTTNPTAESMELNSFFFDSVCMNSEELANFVNSNFECYDDDGKLAKDAIGDDEPTPTKKLSDADRFTLSLLKKVWPMVKTNKENMRKAHDFLDNLFNNASYNGESVLHLAVKSDDSFLLTKVWEIIHKFKFYGLIQIQNMCNETCLHTACLFNKPNSVAEFVRYGADVNAVDAKGDTALHIAINENNDKCVLAILNSKALSFNNESETNVIDLNVLNDNGFTPVHLAIRNKNLAIVHLLEKKSSAMNVPIYEKSETKNGNTALHLAVEVGSFDIVKHILKHKRVDVNMKNLSGHTALYLARVIKDRNTTDLINLLREYNAQDVPSDEDDSSSVDSSSDIKDKKDQMEISTNELDMRAQSKQMSSSSAPPSKANSKFDDICLTQLCDIFGKNEKWKSIAKQLGYETHLKDWEKTRNPAKMLFMFSEALRVPKNDIIKIFNELGEGKAVDIINEWKRRNSSL